MAIEELQDGRYRFVRSIGSGGMGEVYRMQDVRINRQVAIKVMRSEGASSPESTAAKEAARLFQREARAIAALEHPNILPLYDFGEEVRDGTIITYMVMPFCAEGSLAGWLMEHGTMLTPQDVSHLVDQAAEGLQHAHDQNAQAEPHNGAGPCPIPIRPRPPREAAHCRRNGTSHELPLKPLLHSL